MHYFIGLVRSAVLYYSILAAINGEFIPSIIAFYLLLILIHSVITKLIDHADFSRTFVGALVHDIIEPFLGILESFRLILRKHKFAGSSKFVMIDKAQSYSESIYGIIVVFLLIVNVLGIA